MMSFASTLYLNPILEIAQCIFSLIIILCTVYDVK